VKEAVEARIEAIEARVEAVVEAIVYQTNTPHQTNVFRSTKVKTSYF
jgi:hypothetical protein